MKPVSLLPLAFAIVSAAPPAWCAAPPRPRITGIAHISLYVHDIARSRAFYEDFLGYR